MCACVCARRCMGTVTFCSIGHEPTTTLKNKSINWKKKKRPQQSINIDATNMHIIYVASSVLENQGGKDE